MTEWRTIADFPYYQVSADGRVRRWKTRVGGATEPRLIKPSTTPDGYFRCMLCHHGRKKNFSVHVLVAEQFIGSAPSEQHRVAHYDGNPENNNVANLRWATFLENEDDKLRHGRRMMGESHHQHKLSDADVMRLREAVRSGQSITEAAIGCGIKREAANRAITGKGWKHLPGAARSKYTRRGENNRFAKLRESDVVQIKAMQCRGDRPKDIAARFGVTTELLRMIRRGQVWKDVTLDQMNPLAAMMNDRIAEDER